MFLFNLETARSTNCSRQRMRRTGPIWHRRCCERAVEQIAEAIQRYVSDQGMPEALALTLCSQIRCWNGSRSLVTIAYRHTVENFIIFSLRCSEVAFEIGGRVDDADEARPSLLRA